VSAAEAARPISAAEAKTLFRPLAQARALVLAVSGGPDSTALLYLAGRWRRSLKKRPALLAVTIDHGLRPESAEEARAVRRLARTLGVRHRIRRWEGSKPQASLQEAARVARYHLLAKEARSCGAHYVVTAHTLDDQAETVLFRMSRGSGLRGLTGMRQLAPLPCPERARNRTEQPLWLARPFLEVPKTRLIATLARAHIQFAEDASNQNTRFSRTRWRELMPSLAREGLDAERIALIARRLTRADAALEAAVDQALDDLAAGSSENGPIVLDARRFLRLPAEIGIRLLGRAIAHHGNEGALRLGQLETLHAAIVAANAGGVRRTLAGALLTLRSSKLVIEQAPPRRQPAALPKVVPEAPLVRPNDAKLRKKRRFRSIPLADGTLALRLGKGTDVNRPYPAGIRGLGSPPTKDKG
jgi:tRNA(Ile)-lysidine synthase